MRLKVTQWKDIGRIRVPYLQDGGLKRGRIGTDLFIYLLIIYFIYLFIHSYYIHLFIYLLNKFKNYIYH